MKDVLLLSLVFAPITWSFQHLISKRMSVTPHIVRKLSSSIFAATTTIDGVNTPIPTSDDIRRLKADLVSCCSRPPKPSVDEVNNIVRELETVAEQVSIVIERPTTE